MALKSRLMVNLEANTIEFVRQEPYGLFWVSEIENRDLGAL